jgi:dTMP kinase
MHLLFAANRWELAQTLRKHITQGTHIVVDRYALSGIAYTAAQGVDTQWATKPDQLLPAPDVVFFMDINPEDAKKRGDFGKELYEREDMQRRVREQYGKLKHAIQFEWRDIEAGRDMDTIHKELLESTLEIIERVQHTELSHLKFNQEEENKASHS